MKELDSNAVCQHVQTFNDRWVSYCVLLVKNSIVVLGQAINDIEVWFDRGVLA
jgi:hypothetical protein